MILTRFSVPFTSPSPVKIRPGTGVAGSTHRYMGQDVAAAVGATVTSWADSIGGAALTGANGPKVRALSGSRKYLEFDGVNDTLKNDSMPGDVGTVVMVARSRSTDTGTTILASGIGVTINRAGASGTMLNPGAGVVNPVQLDNQWRVVIATATADEASLTIDGTRTTATAAGIWGTSLRLGANGAPNYFSMLDCLEVITYPGKLTPAQGSTIRDSLRAAYPDLLP